MDSTLFDLNLSALRERSPKVAELVRLCGPDAATEIVTTAAGLPVVVYQGRPLDSRRDPLSTARRAVSQIACDPVVLFGFGSGYLAEAVVAQGLEVAGIVAEGAAPLAAAMGGRDLRAVLSQAPILLLGQATDGVDLAVLRARSRQVVPAAASLAANPELAALLAHWDTIRVSERAPRVLVVGPLEGGSLGVARYAADAWRQRGADTRFFDAAVFGSAYRSFADPAIPGRAHAPLQGGLVDLIASAVVEQALGWRPDLIFCLAQAPMGRSALLRLADAGMATAFWFVENARILTYWRELAGAYQWFFAIQPGPMLERFGEAGAARARYLPVACDPERHRPVALTAPERRRFGAPVSFAGAPYLNRRRMFAGLTDFGPRLWGAGWNDPPLRPFQSGGGEPFSLEEEIRIFAGTAVNLNLHSAEHVEGLDPEPDYLNPRTFELAACGAFQLVDRRIPLRSAFREDEVVAFSSLPELRELIEYYLAHPDERRETAARARRRALAEHTYAHRMEEVMRLALPPELAAAALSGRRTPTLAEAIGEIEAASDTMHAEEAALRVVAEIGRTELRA